MALILNVLLAFLDSSILIPTPLGELRTAKTYLKATAKRDKELESLRKKHEKVWELSHLGY